MTYYCDAFFIETDLFLITLFHNLGILATEISKDSKNIAPISWSQYSVHSLVDIFSLIFQRNTAKISI